MSEDISINRRLKETVFSGDKSTDRFRSLSKRMLEAQTEVQFEDVRTELRAFIDEKEKRQPLRNWLAWWVTRKERIFRAFKRKNAPKSNLAEVVHSAWVAQKRTQLSLFELAVDDNCEMVNTKQMLKGCGQGSFGGGTGSSIQCLDKRKRAQNDSVLTKIMQASSSYENAENECSPPEKKTKTKTKEKEGNTSGQGNSCKQMTTVRFRFNP